MSAAITLRRSVEPILGAALTAAFREALVAFWRQWTPTLRSSRARDQQNVVNNVDCMALCSVSVEAKEGAGWPAGLSAADAKKAAELGVLEIGGFPIWFDKLTVAFPAEVRAVLMTEIRAQIDLPCGDTAFGLCDLGLGMPELRHVRLSDLASIRGPLNQPIERDLYFTPRRALSEYARLAHENGSITD